MDTKTKKIEIPLSNTSTDVEIEKRLQARFRFDDLINGKFYTTDEYCVFLNNEFRRLNNSLKKHTILDKSNETMKCCSRLLTNFLNYTIGSPDQVRSRKVQSAGNSFSTFFGLPVVFTGSRQEGFRFAHADIDMMFECSITSRFSHYESDNLNTPFIIHIGGVKPGFAKIECRHCRGIEQKLIFYGLLLLMSVARSGFNLIQLICKSGIKVEELIFHFQWMLTEREDSGKLFVSSKRLAYLHMQIVQMCGVPFSDNADTHIHGPCASGGNDNALAWDLTVGLYCAYRSQHISSWSNREREYGWPHRDIIKKALDQGFHLVPIGNKTSNASHLEWRFSFCKVELHLVDSFNQSQLQCYALLKIFLKQVIESQEKFCEILSSYFMKTLMFWAIEESDKDKWRPENLIERFRHCISQYLIPWVKKGMFPNYFIPEANLLDGRMEKEKGEHLWRFIESNYNGNWDIMTLDPNLICTRNVPQIVLLRECLSSPRTPVCFQERELEQINDYTYFVDVLGCIELPTFLQTEEKCVPPTKQAICEKFKSTDVPLHVIQMYENFSLHEWHKKTMSKSASEKQEILPQIENLIIDRIDQDVSSLRLCLATFYYVNGDYKKSLTTAQEVDIKMKSHVVHLLSAGLIETENAWEIERDLEYLGKICGRGLSMDEKCKVALARDYLIPHGSLLIPKELYLSNAKEGSSHPLRLLQLAPLFYSQFLTFLCQHHIGMTTERDQTFARMGKIEQREKVDYRHHYYVMLGICYQMQGNLDEAFRHFALSYDVMEKDDIWYYKHSLLLYGTILLLKVCFEILLYQISQIK